MIMNQRRPPKQRAGFTLTEFFVLLAILALFGCLLLPSFFRAKERAQRIRCTSFLKQIGLASRQWARANVSIYPMSISTYAGGTEELIPTGEVWPHFQVMSNELNTPFVLKCPADRERAARSEFGPNLSNTNISYFVGVDADETKPQMFLAGDRNLIGGRMLPNRILFLRTNEMARWGKDLHKYQESVALSDGSVQGFTSSRLQEALANTGVETNRLAIP